MSIEETAAVLHMKRSYIGCFVSCLGLICHGCNCAPIASKSVVENDVVIGSLMSSDKAEELELTSALKAHAIESYTEGSVTYDIIVRKSQAERAVAILKTNRLSIERRLVLSGGGSSSKRIGEN